MHAASWEEALVGTSNRVKDGCETELVENWDGGSWEEALVDTSNRVKDGCETELVENWDGGSGAACAAVQEDGREESVSVWCGTKLSNALHGCTLVG